MPLRSTEEKVKPFRLVKYFTIASLIVVFLGTVILSFLNVHWAIAMQRKKSEAYARLLVETLNHQVFLQFIVPIAMKYGRIQLRDEQQHQILDKVVRSTLHSFKVDRVNIYDMEGTVSYSFDTDLLGRRDLAGKGYQDALEGRSTFKLVQKGNWLEIMLGLSKENRIVTFAPLRAEKPLSGLSGPVIGVVEIVQDLSEEYIDIYEFQIFVITTSTCVMGLLLVVLIFVVKRGEGIIEKRALERLRLKEKLQRAEHLSSIGEMMAAVSHEIRNPLGIIRSSAELLKKRCGANGAAGAAIHDIIVEESNRLNDIITDFLNFAKPIEPDLAPCSVADILEKNIRFLSPRIEEEGYAIEMRRRDDDVPDIQGDANMLYQAFLNLLINGMQAMPDGGRITVDIRFDDPMVTVTLSDEGEGIPASDLLKIWDPFYTTKEKGTGLGLGIVKNIVRSHDGEVELRNLSPKGVAVTVKLPAAPVPSSPASPPEGRGGRRREDSAAPPESQGNHHGNHTDR